MVFSIQQIINELTHYGTIQTISTGINMLSDSLNVRFHNNATFVYVIRLLLITIATANVG